MDGPAGPRELIEPSALMQQLHVQLEGKCRGMALGMAFGSFAFGADLPFLIISLFCNLHLSMRLFSRTECRTCGHGFGR